MKSKWDAEIQKAIKFWDDIAQKNGWSMLGRFVQLWVTGDKVIDSIYLPLTATSHMVCDYETENIIERVA